MTALLVTSTGGHLSELVRLRPRLVGDEPVTWVTFPGAQADDLLRGEHVVPGTYMAPRGYRGLAMNSLLARRLLAMNGVGRVISNGAGIALAFLPMARARGIDAHYIESAARPHGPSLSGRLLARVPGVKLYSQYESWAGGRWAYRGSVLDRYAVERGPVMGAPGRVLVLLGTMPYPFTRLVHRLRQVLPRNVEVVWQHGSTPLHETARSARPAMPPAELRAALREADVVVAQGGIGSTLDALDAGRLPVLVPRRRSYGEHVDDHQAEMAHAFADRGLAIAREAGELSWSDLELAAAARVRTSPTVPPFRLG